MTEDESTNVLLKHNTEFLHTHSQVSVWHSRLENKKNSDCSSRLFSAVSVPFDVFFPILLSICLLSLMLV